MPIRGFALLDTIAWPVWAPCARPWLYDGLFKCAALRLIYGSLLGRAARRHGFATDCLALLADILFGPRQAAICRARSHSRAAIQSQKGPYSQSRPRSPSDLSTAGLHASRTTLAAEMLLFRAKWLDTRVFPSTISSCAAGATARRPMAPATVVLQSCSPLRVRPRARAQQKRNSRGGVQVDGGRRAAGEADAPKVSEDAPEVPRE